MPKSDRSGRVVAILALAVVAVALNGCITHRSLASSTVSFNRAVEEAQNRMLLLNAVRSSKRRPMYVTGVSNVTGSLRSELSAGLDLPFGGKDDDNKGSPRATYSVSPSYVVPVLDTQEFMQGFLTPVSNKTLAYYWDQGWPKTFLLHLLVQQVRVTTEEKVTRGGKELIVVRDYLFQNYPDVRDPSLCQFQKFSRLVDAYLDPVESDPRFEVRTSTRDVGPLLFREQLGEMKDFIAANKDGFEIVEAGNQFRLRRREAELVLVAKGLAGVGEFVRRQKGSPCSEVRGEAGVLRSEREAPVKSDGRQQEPEGDASVEISQAEPQLKTYTQQEIETGTEETAVGIDFFLRSPEAVLYYLGQLVRFEEENQSVPEICVQGYWQPIFVGRKPSTDCPFGLVMVDYEDTHYLIPANPGEERACRPGDPPPLPPSPLECAAGRSMQALSLLNQLIALQKSAKDLPGTSVIRTIGQ